MQRRSFDENANSNERRTMRDCAVDPFSLNEA
jgi:hypothetical protein